jgi:hypothetical protein
MDPTLVPMATPGRDRDPNSLTFIADGFQLPRLSTAERLALNLDSRYVGFTLFDVTTQSSWEWTVNGWVESASLDGSATNTEILYMDGTKVAGDPRMVWDKTLGSMSVGSNTSTDNPTGRTLNTYGNALVTAGTGNPNGVELRVIGLMIPYHSHFMINGLTGGFASNADHTHLVWNNFADGTTQQTQVHQEIYTVSGGTPSFVSYGYPFTALGTEFANEASIDTTGTVQTPTAPDYIGRILLRYSTDPGISVGENLLFQVIGVQVAGVQAAVYAALSATASTLVGSFWEVQVDVYGLDPIHWNWNNRENTAELRANWQLNRIITPLTGLVSVTAVGASDTTSVDIVFNPVPAQLATSASIGYPISFLIKQASSITGIPTGAMVTGCVTALTYGAGVTARVRLRNMRYQTWLNIGGTDSNPSRFAVYPGIRDVAHDPHQYNCLAIQYRDTNGIPRAVSLGGNDFQPSITKSVAVGMGLVADTSSEVVIGTDNVSNKLRVRNGGIQFGSPDSKLINQYKDITASWTPLLTSTGGTFTITIVSKKAYILGDILFFTVSFTVSNITGTPVDAQIDLPEEPLADCAATIGYADSLDAAARTQLMARIVGGEDQVDLYHYENGVLSDLGPYINIGTELTVSGSYFMD